MIREQLELQATDGREYTLNKYQGKLHFVFPQYAFEKDHNPVKSQEIRIATWGGEVLDSINYSSYDDRRLDNGKYNNLSQAHMFHPKKVKREIKTGGSAAFKGPFGLFSTNGYTVLMAYEHASQDNLADPVIVGGVHGQVAAASKIIVDEKQGASGDEGVDKLNTYLNFLQLHQQVAENSVISGVEIIRGGYLDGELIKAGTPYQSVWTATGFFAREEPDQLRQMMHNYLLKWITEFPQTRKAEFYYNTWGMQRDEQRNGKDLRGVLTYDRIFKEIRNAHDLGADIFVLDDGWEQMQGVWKPNDRLDRGLKPIYDSLQHYGMTMGAWLSPVGIDKRAERYQQHPEWVIRDQDGNPVLAQWDHPAFDFVSGFYALFVQDCKWLIDQGVRFFKWDAINTFYPYQTKGYHGDDRFPKEEVIARYGYLLPIYVKRAMEELMRYNPDVVIEIDLTEDRRSLPGLATLSAGKLFWMNNGASGYGDYSQFRAKSMRTIANVYDGIIPLQLFTYANYPMNAFPYFSQRYNVNTSLVAGRGFWGNLDVLNEAQRKRVGMLVNKSKLVLPYLQETMTQKKGNIGASPEIYADVNTSQAAGQVIAFSGSAMDNEYKIPIESSKMLGVLDNAFTLKDDTLKLPFQFPMADASREAFILPNKGTGIKIVSSTSWLDRINLTGKKLQLICGAPGEINIVWPKSIGKPSIDAQNCTEQITTEDDHFLIQLIVTGFNVEIKVE